MEKSFAIETVKVLVIVTGCAHAGIINLVKSAKKTPVFTSLLGTSPERGRNQEDRCKSAKGGCKKGSPGPGFR